ncbi:hypothetical protein Bca4012_082742 [Brassica carinata]
MLMSKDQVLVERKAKSSEVILDRPSSFNALSAPMVGRLNRQYECSGENPTISLVLVKGIRRFEDVRQLGDDDGVTSLCFS